VVEAWAGAEEAEQEDDEVGDTEGAEAEAGEWFVVPGVLEERSDENDYIIACRSCVGWCSVTAYGIGPERYWRLGGSSEADNEAEVDHS
jgi:hypothetical protein